MSIVKLTKDNFNSETAVQDKPVLIDFFAVWCGPCRMLSPIVDEIAEENSGVKVCKVNVDDEPELAQSFDVSSIPTLVVLKNGKLINKSVGYIPKDEILAMLPGLDTKATV